MREGSYKTALKQLQLLDEHYQNTMRTLYHQYETRLRLVDDWREGSRKVLFIQSTGWWMEWL